MNDDDDECMMMTMNDVDEEDDGRKWRRVKDRVSYTV